MSRVLYEKRGRRYVPAYHEQDFYRAGDLLPVGGFRLAHCPEPGATTYSYDVTPDTAPLVAAGVIARQAMEAAITEMAQARPTAAVRTYSTKQLAALQEARASLAGVGVTLPTYWTSASARDIAQAGVDALMKAVTP